ALGLRLFENARKETHTQQALADRLRREQNELREQMQQDMSHSLHTYDQWIGKIETDFTARLDQLDKRMGDLQQQWMGMTARVEAMMNRAEKLLDQARLISEAAVKFSKQSVMQRPTPSVQDIESAPAQPESTVTELPAMQDAPVEDVNPRTLGTTLATTPASKVEQPGVGDNEPMMELPSELVEVVEDTTPVDDGPTVRYMKLLELLRQKPPTQNAA
ncbi:MAG: hypothetical protein HC898_11980, partial [Phycisphaerales bacterium]|nr:hypothetical protein [Phycisphaerales bacterium]